MTSPFIGTGDNGLIPTEDPILALLNQMRGAHGLPPTVVTAPRTPHGASGTWGGMKPMVITAKAPPEAHLLAAMRSTAKPLTPSGPATWQDPTTPAAQMPVAGLLASAPPAMPAPSAVSAMLQGLLAQHTAQAGGDPSQQSAPPQGGPGPQAPPMAGPPPQGPPPPDAAPPQQKSLFDRIKGNISGLLDSGKPDAPPGYEGLLTPEEIKGAQPGRMASLLSLPLGALHGAAMTQAYQANLDHIIQMHQLATATAEHKRIMDFRHEIASEPELPPDATIEQTKAHLARIFDRAASVGDTDMMQHYGSRLNSLFAIPKPETTGVLPAGGTTFSKTTGLPIFTAPSADKANDYTQYVDPAGNTHVLKKDENPPAGWKPISLDKTQITVNAADTRAANALDAADKRFSTRQVTTLQKQYSTDIAPLKKVAQAYDKALYTFDRAMHSPDPTERKMLFGSVYSQFVQTGDQPNNLRYQLLKYYEHNINPSLAGSFQIFLDKITKGELPPAILNAMTTHIKGLQQETYQQIERRRQEFLKNNDGRIDETQLPTTDTYFPFTGGTPGAPANPGAAAVNPFRKKP